MVGVSSVAQLADLDIDDEISLNEVIAKLGGDEGGGDMRRCVTIVSTLYP